MEIEYKENNKRPRLFSRDVTPVLSGRNLIEEDLNIYEMHEILHVWYSSLKDKDNEQFFISNEMYIVSNFLYNNFKLCKQNETNVDELKNKIWSYCVKEPCTPIDVCHMLIDEWNKDNNNKAQENNLKDKDNKNDEEDEHYNIYV